MIDYKRWPGMMDDVDEATIQNNQKDANYFMNITYGEWWMMVIEPIE